MENELQSPFNTGNSNRGSLPESVVLENLSLEDLVAVFGPQ